MRERERDEMSEREREREMRERERERYAHTPISRSFIRYEKLINNQYSFLGLSGGAGIAQWLERRTRD